jgi:hypothetical protein
LFRALKEFRQLEKEPKPANAGQEMSASMNAARQALGSFLPVESIQSVLDGLPPLTPSRPASKVQNSPSETSFELPMAIGRAG